MTHKLPSCIFVLLTGPILLEKNPTSSGLGTPPFYVTFQKNHISKYLLYRYRQPSGIWGITACFKVCATQNIANIKVMRSLGPHRSVRLFCCGLSKVPGRQGGGKPQSVDVTGAGRGRGGGSGRQQNTKQGWEQTLS